MHVHVKHNIVHFHMPYIFVIGFDKTQHRPSQIQSKIIVSEFDL